MRQWTDPSSTSEDLVKLPDATILEPRAGNEIAPEAPQCPASQRPIPRPKGHREAIHENMGDPLAFPDTQTPKRLRTADKDEVFSGSHCGSFRDGPPSSGKQSFDSVVAVNNAAMGWPARSGLYGVDVCNLLF